MCNELNRQARHGDSPWESYGPITHVAAAELFASRRGLGQLGPLIIETRDEGSDVVFRHRVRCERKYHVVPLRGDA